MNTPIYDVDYFIKKFSAIPEEYWLSNGMIHASGGRHCAYGHCGQNGAATKEGKCLTYLFGKNVVADINDGKDENYQQPTAKQRILSALQDIKKLQEPKPKEVIRYVSVSESLKKQTKELIEN